MYKVAEFRGIIDTIAPQPFNQTHPEGFTLVCISAISSLLFTSILYALCSLEHHCLSLLLSDLYYLTAATPYIVYNALDQSLL